MSKTFREYLSQLKQFAKDNPETLDLPVVYSIDDEGNDYKHIHFDASSGEWVVDDEEISAVCIN